MSTKRVEARAGPDRDQLIRKLDDDTPPLVDIANLLTEGIATNTGVLRMWAKTVCPENQLDLTALHESMERSGARVKRNDLSQGEALLMSQAIALNAMFAECAMRAYSNTRIESFQINMRLALRVQSNCRATLETLATMKNPPAVFAKQANLSQGGQVINNGTIQAPARTERAASAPNKLLEGALDGERLDGGTATATAGGDPALAAVDTLNGTAHGSRQGAHVPQRLPRRGAAHAAGLGARARGGDRAVRAGAGRSDLTGKG